MVTTENQSENKAVPRYTPRNNPKPPPPPPPPPPPRTPQKNPFASYKDPLESENSPYQPSKKKLRPSPKGSQSVTLGNSPTTNNPFRNLGGTAGCPSTPVPFSSSVSSSGQSPSESHYSSSQSSNSHLLGTIAMAITRLKGHHPKTCSHCNIPIRDCCRQAILDEVLNQLSNESNIDERQSKLINSQYGS